MADYLAHCGISQVKGTGAEVFTHPERGVSFITLYGTVRTPEGVRLGSSLSAVRAACQLDYREVAGHLGIPEGTVKSRIHQARGHVHESLTRGM